MKRCLTAVVLGTLMLGAGGCQDPPTEADEDVLVVSRLLHLHEPALSEEADPLQLQTPVDILAMGGRLFVTEIHGSRVTVLDTLLGLEARFGGRGEGPGELATPMTIHGMPGGLIAVEEWGNGRYSFFTARGEFVRFLRDGGKALNVSPLDEHTLVYPGSGGDEPRVWTVAHEEAPAAFAGAGGSAQEPRQTALDRIHVTGSGEASRVVVVRVATGVLEVYGRDGRHHRTDTIPEAVRRAMAEAAKGNRRIIERLGGEPAGLNIFGKTSSATASGEILILLPLRETAGLLYDPRAGR